MHNLTIAIIIIINSVFFQLNYSDFLDMCTEL